MAKVIVNKRANLYHDNGNNKVDFEDNLYRVLSANREYVKKLLNGEKFYPDIPQPFPTGYIYPTSYSEDSWATLMSEPYSTEHTYPASFTQEGNVVTLSVSDFFGYDIQPCVAVINCDIGDNEGVLLSAKLAGMIPAYVSQSEKWENIANVFTAELVLDGDGIESENSTLTFTTDEDVTVNSITIYYTDNTPPEPPTPTPDYYTADTTTDLGSVLTPLDTPTAETEAEETTVEGWRQGVGEDRWISHTSVLTGSVGGYLLITIEFNDEQYKLLAQGINEDAYTYGSVTSQVFELPNLYTADVHTLSGDGALIITVKDMDNLDTAFSVVSTYLYKAVAPTPPSSYITSDSVTDTTNSLAPLVTPTAETELDEDDISNKFSQDGNNVQAEIYDACVSTDGGYLLLDIEIDNVDYVLLAQSIKNQGYSYGAAIHQYFTAGNYTVDVEGEETYVTPHLIISATDIDSHSVEVTLNSATRYFGEV